MCWSRITINAAMLAASIRINACFKTDIRAVVTSDDRFGRVAKVLGCPPRSFSRSGVSIDHIEIIQIDMQFLEAIGRTPRGATSPNGRVTLRSFLNDGAEFLFRRHVVSSHEHIGLSNKFLAQRRFCDRRPMARIAKAARCLAQAPSDGTL